MADKKVLKELAAIAKEWKKAKAQTGFSRLDDGDFVAKIVKMDVNKSKGGTGRLQAQTTFKIMDGDNKGVEVSRFDGLEEQGISYFKGMCEVLEIELPDDPSELPEVLTAFVDECDDLFNIQLKTKNEYQNLYLKGPSEYVEDEEDEEEDDEDDETEESDEEETDDEEEDEDEDEEDDDEDEEDDEEEDEKPKSKSKSKVKPKAKPKAKAKAKPKAKPATKKKRR